MLEWKPDLEQFTAHDLGRISDLRRRLAPGLGGQQLLGVGMPGRGEQRRDRTGFDNLAVVHHAHPIGQLAHDAQIMGDKQDRQSQTCLQVLEQGQNLCLNGDIQRRGRLVGNQQVRIVGQGHGDHHPLALTAGQFMRQSIQAPRRIGQTDQLQQFQNPCPQPRPTQALVQDQGFTQLPLDGMQRVQRGHRLLKHHGNLVAANLAQALR